MMKNEKYYAKHEEMNINEIGFYVFYLNLRDVYDYVFHVPFIN